MSSSSLSRVAVASKIPSTSTCRVDEIGGEPAPRRSRTLNRALQPEAAPVYKIAAFFRERCLQQDHSLLWPESCVWTTQNLERLQNVFLANPARPGNSFYDLWAKGLSGEPKDVYRIAADLVAFYCLFPADLSPQAKVQKVSRVIDWGLAEEAPDLALLGDAYRSFIGTTGRLYFARIHQQLYFFACFAKAAKRDRVDLENVTAVKHLAIEVMSGMQYVTPARNILLHLLFPEQVEGIMSQAHRQKIVDANRAFPDQPDDPDSTLHDIRSGLSHRFGSPTFDYYSPRIRLSWDLPKRRTNRKDRKAHQPKEGIQQESPRTWIFQSNPKRRNVAAEIASASSLSWPLKQFRGEVKVGDTVYLWESGANGGIVGVAEVSALLLARANSEEQMSLGFPGSPKRKRNHPKQATLKVVRAIEPALQHKQLSTCGKLASLTILRQPRGTNFRVAPEEALALATLLATDRSAPLSSTGEKIRAIDPRVAA